MMSAAIAVDPAGFFPGLVGFSGCFPGVSYFEFGSHETKNEAGG